MSSFKSSENIQKKECGPSLINSIIHWKMQHSIHPLTLKSHFIQDFCALMQFSTITKHDSVKDVTV